MKNNAPVRFAFPSDGRGPPTNPHPSARRRHHVEDSLAVALELGGPHARDRGQRPLARRPCRRDGGESGIVKCYVVRAPLWPPRLEPPAAQRLEERLVGGGYRGRGRALGAGAGGLRRRGI